MTEKLSCGIVLARNEAGRCLTLLLRASQYWDFPKGINEAGETPLETAVRELHEETGIDEASFDWGERYMDTGPYSQGKVARYYIASTNQADVVIGPSPDTGEPEHHEWRWFTFDEAYDITAPRVKEVVRWSRQVIGV